jgi:23S rRNA pseudouridine2605 synthase
MSEVSIHDYSMLERLQKIIARAGIASRRHAEQLILSGQVFVNGEVVTELGTKADPELDRIEAAGRAVRIASKPIHLLLHKPSEVVSTMADPEGRRTLRDLLRGMPERVFPVGRLDYAASGLILLTNDGELANRLLKAAPRLAQTYWIKVKGRLTEEQLQQLARDAHGEVRPLKAPRSARGRAANAWYEVALSEARRDLLRRALRTMGHPVEKMKRLRLGNLELAGLPEGRYRSLEPGEVAGLERALAPGSQLPATQVHLIGAHKTRVSRKRFRAAVSRKASGKKGS